MTNYPTFVQVSREIESGDRFMDDQDWTEWADLVWEHADEHGAWFIIGQTTNEDVVVLPCWPVYNDRADLETAMRRLNVRTILSMWRIAE